MILLLLCGDFLYFGVLLLACTILIVFSYFSLHHCLRLLHIGFFEHELSLSLATCNFDRLLLEEVALEEEQVVESLAAIRERKRVVNQVLKATFYGTVDRLEFFELVTRG